MFVSDPYGWYYYLIYHIGSTQQQFNMHELPNRPLELFQLEKATH